MVILNKQGVHSLLINDAKTVVKEFISKGIKVTPFLLGESGIGKTEIIREIANELGYRLVDIRLAQMEPGDAIGLPHKYEKDGVWVTTYARPFWFPGDNDEKTIIFVDELPQANRDVQAAFFQLLYDRELNGNKLAEKHMIVSAGNPAVGNYNSMELDTALKDRLAVIEVTTSLDSWMEWSSSKVKDIPALRVVRGYLSTQPDMLNQKDHSEVWSTDRKPSSRSWFRLAEIFSKCTFPENLEIEVAASMVGHEGAVGFIKALRDELRKPVSAKEIFENGLTEDIVEKIKSSSNDMINMTRSDLVDYAKENHKELDMTLLADAIELFPDEHIIVFFKEITGTGDKKFNSSIASHSALSDVAKKMYRKLRETGSEGGDSGSVEAASSIA